MYDFSFTKDEVHAIIQALNFAEERAVFDREATRAKTVRQEVEYQFSEEERSGDTEAIGGISNDEYDALLKIISAYNEYIDNSKENGDTSEQDGDDSNENGDSKDDTPSAENESIPRSVSNSIKTTTPNDAFERAFKQIKERQSDKDYSSIDPSMYIPESSEEDGDDSEDEALIDRFEFNNSNE